MLTKLLKATHARILAHYMRIHPRACNTRKRDKTLEEYREWQASRQQAS